MACTACPPNANDFTNRRATGRGIVEETAPGGQKAPVTLTSAIKMVPAKASMNLSKLWAHMLTMMLEGEHVAVELRHPLTTLHRQLEVANRVTDIGLDLAPEESRVL